MVSDIEMQAPGSAGAPLLWRERLNRIGTHVPTLAVVSVVVTALAATVMVTRPDWQNASRPAVISKYGQAVVKAPPLVVKAPPVEAAPGSTGPQRHAGAANSRSKTLGAGPSCRNCGVVESVAPTRQYGAVQMRIRMDDGTLRTVEQRGAIAAGSRVLLDRGSVRVMPG
ncbi:MAG TPA: hypothetical protein VN649_14510 [Ramlibacter sp.]|nr:hypothetical protein [Ramlibacter sp.]